MDTTFNDQVIEEETQNKNPWQVVKNVNTSVIIEDPEVQAHHLHK
jgi:hypothetical protein